MSSGTIRGPLTDHRSTPQNPSLVLLDDQPAPPATVRSTDPELPLNNIASTVNTAKAAGPSSTRPSADPGIVNDRSPT